MVLLPFLIILIVGFSVEGNSLPICESGRSYGSFNHPNIQCSRRSTLHNSYNNQSFEYVSSQLKQFCHKGADAQRDCDLSIYSACSDKLKTNITRWYKEHKEQFCSGSNVRQEVKDVLPEWVSLNNQQGCLKDVGQPSNSSFYDDLNECYYASLSLLPINDSSIYFYVNQYNRFYNSIYRCYLSVLSRHVTCTHNEYKALLFDINYHIRPGLKLTVSVEDNTRRQTPRYGRRSTVMAFGDPHLKVYKQKRFIACTAAGERVYLYNNYLRITATNTFLPGSNVATIITQLSITFINNRVTIATYNASDSKLPASFTNGKDSATAAQAVTVKANGNIAVITNEKSGIVVYIRRYEHTYPMLLVRMADNILDTSAGLFADGCSDVIDISSGRRKRSSDECDAVCNEVDEEYKDPCYFDCDVTGDAKLASVTAEIKTYQKEAEAADKELSDGGGAAGGAATVRAQYYIMIISISLISCCWSE